MTTSVLVNTVNPSAPAATDMADLKRKSVRGGATTLAAQAITIAIQLASTVVLARLLSPGDYGVMAMVMAVTGFAALFRDLGLASAAIQKKDLSRAQQSNLFWLNVAMGAVLTGLVAAAAPLVAWFYGKPELTSLTVALSLSFLVGSLGTQAGAMLVRDMKFARQAIANISGAIAGLAVSITLASQGYSYWALAWGSLFGGMVATLLLFRLSAFRPGLWTRGAGIRDMLTFGATVTAFDIVNYFHRNLDHVLIGRFWGAEALGLYSRAYSLLMLPIGSIRGPINAVAFPAMSKLQQEPEAYRTYYRRITAIVAFLSMPLCAYLFVTSRPIIELALGQQWLGVVPIFSVLAISSFIQPVASLRGLVMLSTARGKDYLTWGVFNAVTVSVGFVCGLPWGAMGIAISYAIANYAILYPSLVLAFKGTPLRKRDFFQPLARPAFASLVGVAAALLIKRHMGSHAAIQSLGISTIAFAVPYLAAFAIAPGGVRELKTHTELWRQFRSQRKGNP